MVNFNQSGVSENTAGMCSAGVEAMREEACGQRVISDKFEKAAYHHMYGVFLWPLRFARHKVKLLEIGLNWPWLLAELRARSQRDSLAVGPPHC